MVKLDISTASAADLFMEEQMRSVFQWEKSSGLEHSCYACNTKSNSPKALQTCYGIHSIPCSRYHQTMHAIGTSHNCDACIKADSLHDCRHRKIAELLAEHRSLCVAEVTPFSNKKNKKGNSVVIPTTPTPLRERNVNAANGANNVNPIRRLPRNLEPLDIENINIHADDDDEEADNDTSTVSSTPTTSTSPSSTATTTSKPTKAEIRASKRAAKQAKSEQKSLKNQSKHPVIVRATDVAHVHFVLHGEVASDQSGNPSFPSTPGGLAAAIPNLDLEDGEITNAPIIAEPASRHPLATDTAIEDVLQRNIGYVTHIKEHKAYLLRSVAGKKRTERAKRVKRDKSRVTPVAFDEDGVAVFEDDGAENHTSEEDMDILVDAILVKLGVDVPIAASGAGTGASTGAGNLTTPNGKRGLSSSGGSGGGGGAGNQAKNAMLAQLRVAIGDDIRKHENEQRMTCIRAGGFWRYVGKGVFERMMRVGERIDWRTGVIIREEKERGSVDHDVDVGDGVDGDANGVGVEAADDGAA